MRLLLPTLAHLIAASLFCGAVTLDFPDAPPTGSPDGIPEPVLEAFRNGRFEKALAGADEAEATAGTLYLLGWLYENGQGTDPDLSKAGDYYQQASKAGHPGAVHRLAIVRLEHEGPKAGPQIRRMLEEDATRHPALTALLLGELHARGLVGPPSFDQAFAWWTRSAEAGEIRARHNLGRLLDGSFGFPDKRDPKAALAAFRAAAEAGYADAMTSIGSRLMHGDVALRNEKAGLDWLQKAARAGNPGAHFLIGDYYEFSKKDSRNALRSYHAGAELDDIRCLLRAGEFYSRGIGTTPDPARALELFKKAAALGSTEGDFRTALTILQDSSNEISLLEGYKFLLTAATAGHARAQNELGLLYLSGRLGAPDPSAAANWFDHAASQDFPSAQNNLAALFEKGLGVTRNLNSAAKLYTQAAAQGHPAATTAIARLHAEGRGVPRNLPRAWALASLAAERGDPNGPLLLEQLTETLGSDNLRAARRILAELKARGTGAPSP